MKSIKLWHPQEHSLLLDVTPERISGTVISENSEKIISLKKIYRYSDWKDLAKAIRPVNFIKNVIISADSTLAYTAVIPIRILREQGESPLFATELENILAQEVGRVFSACREEASKELAIDDLDVILASSRVGEFKIDGHRVLNPIGLKANKIEAVLELVLTTRPLYDQVIGFVNPRQNLFFAESARLELGIISKIERMPIRLLRLRSPFSSRVTLADALIGHRIERKRLSWSSSLITGAITDRWGVSNHAARELYSSYLRKEMAESGSKVFDELFSEVMRSLFDELNKSKLRGKTFISTDMPLPIDYPFKKGNIEFQLAPINDLLFRSGFELSDNWPFTREETFSRLAPFIAFFNDRSDSTVNRWLRRHLNWLGAHRGSNR